MKAQILLIISVFIISSCGKNVECNEGLIPIHFLDCSNSKYNLNIDISNDYTIIISTGRYDEEVTGTCHPNIDFSKYDLIIGTQSTPNENDTIKYDLRRVCPENELILTIDIIQSLATRPDNVVFHALVPKQKKTENIQVIVNVQ